MSTPSHRPDPATIWIVDDSPLDGERIRGALSDYHEVSLFTDAIAVLERLRERPPSLLLLDWVMPGMSGLEVCQFVRLPMANNPNLGVIILTAQTDPEQVAEALAAGADDFVSKPIAPIELRARVGAVLRTRRALERAERAEAAVSALLESSPDGLIAIDRSGAVTFVSKQAEAALGRPSGQLYGRPLQEAIPELAATGLYEDARPSFAPLPDVTIGEQVFSPRVHRDQADGQTTLSLRNVTERRREEARRLDLYSVVAHDLRTPLSSLLMRTHLILSGNRGLVSTELTADLHKMRSTIRDQIAMVSDFLEFGRLEGTSTVFEHRSVDLRAVVARVCDDLAPLAETGKVALYVDAAAPTARVTGDERRLAQVVSNLVGNALKFTVAGGEVRVFVDSHDLGVEVRVKDMGPGMPPELLPHLFQRYVRPLERGNDVPGTGLGLMIVKQIVERHGGEVGVNSVSGEGSTFWFRLPRPLLGDE